MDLGSRSLGSWSLRSRVSGSRFSGLGVSSLRVSGLRSRISGLGSRVSGLGSRVSGLGSRISGLGSRVSGLGSRVSGRARCQVRSARFTANLGVVQQWHPVGWTSPETWTSASPHGKFPRKEWEALQYDLVHRGHSILPLDQHEKLGTPRVGEKLPLVRPLKASAGCCLDLSRRHAINSGGTLKGFALVVVDQRTYQLAKSKRVCSYAVPPPPFQWCAEGLAWNMSLGQWPTGGCHVLKPVGWGSSRRKQRES